MSNVSFRKVGGGGGGVWGHSPQVHSFLMWFAASHNCVSYDHLHKSVGEIEF